MDACGRAGLPTPSASGAETLAPLGAAAAQDGAARRRGHTGTEAVGARPSDLARLVGSFHDALLKISGGQPAWGTPGDAVSGAAPGRADAGITARPWR